VRIKANVTIKYPWKLIIGDYVWIGENTIIDNPGLVKIGSNVCISQQSLLLCGNHNYKKTTFDLLIGAITLEDGVWIGARATVCPGIICRSHSVLTAGSVAAENLEPFSVYQGNPAQKVRDRILIS
jgi:putative colanic acid biosynthesis acetyltransferase WcaF